MQPGTFLEIESYENEIQFMKLTGMYVHCTLYRGVTSPQSVNMLVRSLQTEVGRVGGSKGEAEKKEKFSFGKVSGRRLMSEELRRKVKEWIVGT